jgi:hypothetical protein
VTGPSRARYGFAAHPDALRELRDLPPDVRDRALLALQDLVHGHRGTQRLTGALDGYHKAYISGANGRPSWRMVLEYRDAPPGASHPREVYLVAAGPREGYAVYAAAQRRTHRDHLVQQPGDDPAARARLQAARARSPHAPAMPAAPALPPPAATTAPYRKATTR